MRVVIPAAGRGTRFLPVTRAIPKEMLPVGNRPIIDYVVDEALQAGSSRIYIVTRVGKEAIQNYFRHGGLRTLRKSAYATTGSPRTVSGPPLRFIRQSQPLGLSHAIMTARRFVEGSPFGVLVGDTINIATPPILRQLELAFQRLGGVSSVIALRRVSSRRISDYGVIDGDRVDGRTWTISGVVEKPPVDKAPTRMAVIGAYYFSPAVFEAIQWSKRRPGGEFQLSDALNRLVRLEGVYGLETVGEWYDVGTPSLWLRANVSFSRHRGGTSFGFG